MTRDIYALEIPRENISANTIRPPAVVLISSIIYALAVTASTSAYSLLTASIMPAIFIRRVNLSVLAKINLANVVMILTLSLTWPDVKSGFIMGMIIALRVNMIYIAFSVMAYSLGTAGMYEALCVLGVPEKLRVLVILTLRGINILRERCESAIISVRLRAPNIGGLMRLKIFAYIAGNVLLQSLTHSENMMRAVKCRGGFGGFIQSEKRGINAGDIAYVIGFSAYAVIIVVMNYA